MSDMLVKLYSLPDANHTHETIAQFGVQIRHPGAYEKHTILSWIEANFNKNWSSECEVAFSHHPISCYIATCNAKLVGFACFDCTMLNFFGPVGIVDAFKNKGVGKALLLSCLHAMRAHGYAYAIIGSAGPADFFYKVAGATKIEGSEPGIYTDKLKS